MCMSVYTHNITYIIMCLPYLIHSSWTYIQSAVCMYTRINFFVNMIAHTVAFKYHMYNLGVLYGIKEIIVIHSSQS